MKNKEKLFESIIIVCSETGEIEFGTRFNKDFFEYMNLDIEKTQEKLCKIYDELLEEINNE